MKAPEAVPPEAAAAACSRRAQGKEGKGKQRRNERGKGGWVGRVKGGRGLEEKK